MNIDLSRHGDWGLGIGDWAQSPTPIPNPQSPIPNPHENKNTIRKIIIMLNLILSHYFIMFM